MNLLRNYITNKYLLRISVSILLLLFIFIILASALFIYTSQKTTLQMQKELNQKVMSQLFYNIDNMGETTQNLLLSLYFDNDIITLMNSKNIEIYDLYPKLQTLEDTVNTYSFVDSIVIYNVHNQCYYSSNHNSSCKDDGVNQVIDNYLKIDSVPNLRLIPLIKNNSNKETHFTADYLSMFYYRTKQNAVRDSVININIKPEWLTDNITNLNELIEYESSNILLADSNYRVFNQKGESDQVLDEIITLLKERQDTTEGTLVHEINKEKKIISYQKSPKSGWTIINILPYNEVMSNVNKLKDMMVIVTVIILVLGMIVALVLAYSLYKPIMNIMMKINQSNNPEHAIGFVDELAFISNQFLKNTNKIELLKRDQQNNKTIIRSFLLRKWIISNSQLSFDELKAQQQDLNVQLQLNGKFTLCVMTIDHFEAYKLAHRDAEQKNVEFAIENIAHEVFNPTFKNEIFHMRNDHFVMIMNIDDQEEDGKAIIGLMDKVQQTINNYYGISLTVTLSEPVSSFEQLPTSYLKTYEHSMYRIIYGHGKIITPDMIKDNIQNFDSDIPIDIERKISEGIKTNDKKLVMEQLNSMFTDMKRVSYTNINYLLSHVFVVIQRTIREINRNTVHPITIELKDYHQSLFELETLDDIQVLFSNMLNEVFENRDNSAKRDTNDLIIQTIKEIVEENYKDMNLSLKSIADMLRLSPTHANRIFKQSETISIADHIKEIRLNHSIELLMKKDFTVNEIMEEVGFGNQSYFFRVFKKKYGSTPKEYQRSNLLRDL